MIIDIHGHYTTAPSALGAWRDRQIAAIASPRGRSRTSRRCASATTNMRETSRPTSCKLMHERGSDLTVFSPRASFMAHHIGDFDVSETWAAICNELCSRVSELFPDHFMRAAMLPQTPGSIPRPASPS